MRITGISKRWLTLAAGLFLVLVFFLTKTTYAMQVGTTRDLELSGLMGTCGNPDAGVTSCCNQPPAGTGAAPAAGDNTTLKTDTRLNVDPITGDPADAGKKKGKSIWKTISGGISTGFKILTGKSPTDCISDPLACELSVAMSPVQLPQRLTKAGLQAAEDAVFNVMLPYISDFATKMMLKKINISSGAGVGAVGSMNSVDWHCPFQGAVSNVALNMSVAEIEPGSAEACKCFVAADLPDTVFQKSIAKALNVPPSSIAHAKGGGQVAAVNFSPDDFSNRIAQCRTVFAGNISALGACLANAKGKYQQFLDRCKKIESPTEQEDCKKCAAGDIPGQIGGVWTGMGCVPADMGTFVSNKLIPWTVSIAGGIALLILFYAAYLYMTSQGNPEKIKKAKDFMNSGLLGLLLVLGSVFILSLFGVTILKIPGFQ